MPCVAHHGCHLAEETLADMVLLLCHKVACQYMRTREEGQLQSSRCSTCRTRDQHRSSCAVRESTKGARTLDLKGSRPWCPECAGTAAGVAAEVPVVGILTSQAKERMLKAGVSLTVSDYHELVERAKADVAKQQNGAIANGHA